MDQEAYHVAHITSIYTFLIEPVKLHALALVANSPVIIKFYERIEPIVRKGDRSVMVTFYRHWSNMHLTINHNHYNFVVAPKDIRDIRRFLWSCRKQKKK